MRSFIYCLIAVVTFAYACVNRASEHLSSEIMGSSARLPIQGFWKATEVWSSQLGDDGQRRAVYSRDDQLKDGLWRVRMDLDSTGNGFIEGFRNCLGPSVAMGGPARISEYRAMNIAGGILGAVGLLKQTLEEVQCLKSPNATISSMANVMQRKTLLNQEINSLSANLGMFGEKRGSDVLNNECHQLRGSRFVYIENASACVGFTDGSANKIRLIILPAGEIYGIRVNMKRD